MSLPSWVGGAPAVVGSLAEPVIGYSPVSMAAGLVTRRWLRQHADGRPLVIDYYASAVRGWFVGDIRAAFRDLGGLEPCYLELNPVGDVRLLAHRRLLGVLSTGARLRRREGFLRRGLAVELDHPDQWIAFLDEAGARRP